MALGAYGSELSRGNVLNAIAHPNVVNPAAALMQGYQAAGTITDLRTKQFNLQQAQLQPGYDAMRRLLATNPDPTWDDINAAAGDAARNGGNIDPLVQSATSWAGRGDKYTPAAFAKAYALGGMSPETQGTYVMPQRMQVNTGSNLVYGTTPGVLTPNAGQFNPAGSIQLNLPPADAAQYVQVGVNPDGSPKMAPRGGVNWPGVAGVGGGGGSPAVGGVGGGGAPGGGSTVQQGTGAAPNRQAFINSFTPIAQQISAKTGLPVDYLVAQAGLETGWGTSPAYQNNNYFGISPGGTPASYATPQAGIDAYINLMQSGRYSGVPRTGTPAQIGTAMADAGYNPNPGYGATIGQLAASAPPASGPGPFIGATSAQPVTPVRPAGEGGGAAAVQPAGFQMFDPTGRPVGAGGGGGAITAAPYSGLPAGFEKVVGPQIDRANQLQQGVAAGIQTRATLEGMEAELNNLPATGVPSGPLGTLRNFVVSSGLVSQQTADSWAKTQSAQEQFEKFASLLQQQQLGALTGQATDERQALTAASTPSILHTKLGNLGIIHMLEGNQSALQVMGRAWQQAISSGQATPQQFDAWRNQFTAPDKNGGRFDPRVLWMAQMGSDEQRTYGSGLTAKDQAQLKRNVQYAEQQGWIFANQDGSFGTAY